MTTTASETTEITVAQAAKAIADEIRHRGHFQMTNTTGTGGHTVCIVLNNVFPLLSKKVATQLYEEIRDRAKMTSAYPDNRECSLRAKTVIWNDRESTERVLYVLDSIAASDGA